MKISAELSLYPLNNEYKPTIRAYIKSLEAFSVEKSADLDIRTHALSTEIFGEYDQVFAAIQQATKTVFEMDNGVVLIAKYLNKDRS